MNQHRGSDFNEFLAQENLMTPTPRTDAIAHRGHGPTAYIAEITDLARQLERENQTFRAAQKACEDCDAPRVDRIAELERELAVWKHDVKLLEAELEQERQDRKQADLDTIRALGERNEARAEIAVWKHDVKRLEAELETFDEKAIEWWCEYQDLKAKAGDYRAEIDQIKATLANPHAVHVNMLRGTIQWTPANLRHLLGET